jgi:hypothetical protein
MKPYRANVATTGSNICYLDYTRSSAEGHFSSTADPVSMANPFLWIPIAVGGNGQQVGITEPSRLDRVFDVSEDFLFPGSSIKAVELSPGELAIWEATGDLPVSLATRLAALGCDESQG